MRLPASFCGVVGVKPTWGRVSRHGVLDLAPSLDHVGPMTRTVADAAAVLAVLAGRAGLSLPAGQLVTLGAWQVFVFALLSPLGVILTELKIPDPDLK